MTTCNLFPQIWPFFVEKTMKIYYKPQKGPLAQGVAKELKIHWVYITRQLHTTKEEKNN